MPHNNPDCKKEDDIYIGPYTTYKIGSVTKIFTATIIMKLVEEGKIKLDDKVTGYFPEFKNGKDITIENLLGMNYGEVIKRNIFDPI